MIRIWDSVKREEIQRRGSQAGKQLVFSPDRNYLLAWDQSTASMWSLDQAALIADACKRLGRGLTADEWHQYLGDESYRLTCPDRSGAESRPRR